MIKYTNKEEKRDTVHMHTWFSTDSEKHQEIWLKAVEKGLPKTICFTDHDDDDYWNGEKKVS